MKLCKYKHFFKPAECQRNWILLQPEQNAWEHPGLLFLALGECGDGTFGPCRGCLSPGPPQPSSPGQHSPLSSCHCFASDFLGNGLNSSHSWRFKRPSWKSWVWTSSTFYFTYSPFYSTYSTFYSTYSSSLRAGLGSFFLKTAIRLKL